MSKYDQLITDIIHFGAMSYAMGSKPEDGLKRDREITMAKITRALKRMELEDQLREITAPTRLKASEVEALWMRTPYYMKPQAFAAAVQDAAGVP